MHAAFYWHTNVYCNRIYLASGAKHKNRDICITVVRILSHTAKHSKVIHCGTPPVRKYINISRNARMQCLFTYQFCGEQQKRLVKLSKVIMRRRWRLLEARSLNCHVNVMCFYSSRGFVMEH